MTKIIKLSIIFVIFLCIFGIFRCDNVSYAKSDDDENNDFSEYVSEVLDKLDTSDFEEYFDSLDDNGVFENFNIKDLIIKISNGEFELSFSDIFTLIIDKLFKSILSFLPSIISVVIIAIFSIILKNVNSGFIGETSELINFICSVSIITILFNEILGIFSVANNALDEMQKVMEIIFPILLTLIVALGEGGFIKPILSALAGSVISLIKKIILPLFSISVTLSIVGNLSKTVKLKKLSGFFKKIADIFMVIIFSTFMSILTATGIMGKSNYGIAVNSTKFALKSYVPLIGEYLSDGFDVIYLGSILVKNAIGVTGLLILFLTILYPIIKIIAFRVILLFTSAILEPIGDEKTSDILSGVYKSTGILLSVVLGVAFMFFASVLLLTNSYNLGVV